MFRPRAQSSNSPCSFATGKMAFNATKVARAPACFTESKIPMFHRRLKITSDKLGNSSPQLDIDHSMLLYVYYIRCNHIVCIQLYCVIFNYIILYIYMFIYIYIHIVY